MRERRRGVRTIEGTVLPACRDRRQSKCHLRSVTTHETSIPESYPFEEVKNMISGIFESGDY